MPSDTTERLMTDDEVAAVRDQVAATMAQEGLTRQVVSKESGVSYPTLSAWLNDAYDGRSDRVADQLRRWMASRTSRAAARALALPPDAFIGTPSAEAFMTLLTRAQAIGDIGLITGQPGIGKTCAAREYRRRTPQVWMITCSPAVSTPKAVMEALAAELGLLDEQMISRMERQIVVKLRDTGGLVIVDEAQHLITGAIEQLRSVHDKAEVGLVLIGNPGVTTRIEGRGRRAEFAQVFSRVGVRLTNQAEHARRLRADTEALLGSWGIEDAAVRRRLLTVARTDGALRSLRKAVALMRLIAAGEPLTPAHVDMAFLSLAEQKLGADAA